MRAETDAAGAQGLGELSGKGRHVGWSPVHTQTGPRGLQTVSQRNVRLYFMA